MTVSEVMSADVQCVLPSMPVADAKDLMRRKGIHHLVVKNGPKLLGVVSARDLNQRVAAATSRRTVADAMTRHVLSVAGDTTLGRASYQMRGHAVGCLVVLERGRVAGIVTTSDLLGLLGNGAERRPRADTRTAIHHRVAHRHRQRGDGTW